MSKPYAFASAILVLALASAASAASAEPPRGERRGPPPEAIEACAGASEQTACAFVSPRGHDITGSCHQRRETLACLPDRRLRRPRGGSEEERNEE